MHRNYPDNYLHPYKYYKISSTPIKIELTGTLIKDFITTDPYYLKGIKMRFTGHDNDTNTGT